VDGLAIQGKLVMGHWLVAVSVSLYSSNLLLQ
jgi:hypothetical protein